MVFLSAAQAQTVELWVHDRPPLQDALQKKWILEFEAANPGVSTKMTAIPFAGVISFQAKLLTARSTGGGPDLFDLGSWAYECFLENVYIAPLDPVLLGYADAAALLGDYVPATLSFATKDGQVDARFSEDNTLALFCNRDMFDAAGITYLSDTTPARWDDIGAIAGQLTQKDPRTGGFDAVGYQFGSFSNFPSPQWYARNFYAIMRQHGQDDLYVDGEPAADRAAAVAAFRTIYDFTCTCDAYNPDAIANWFGGFPQDRSTMVLAGTWFVPAIRGLDLDLRFGVAPHPVTDPADRATWKNIQWSWGCWLNPNSSDERQRIAHDLLRFVIGGQEDSDQAASWFQNLGCLQPKQGLFAHPDDLANVDANPWLGAFTRTFEDYELGYVQHSCDEAGAGLVRAIDRTPPTAPWMAAEPPPGVDRCRLHGARYDVLPGVLAGAGVAGRVRCTARVARGARVVAGRTAAARPSEAAVDHPVDPRSSARAPVLTWSRSRGEARRAPDAGQANAGPYRP